jgi:hypothetical protein
MIAARLYARALRQSIETIQHSPEGAWGPYSGSRFEQALLAAESRLPWLRQERDVYQTVGHPEAEALAAELAALEALIADAWAALIQRPS